MVRFKNRYVVVEVNPKDTKHTADLVLKSHSIYCSLIQKVQQVHGDFGVAAVKPGLITKYCNKWTRIAMIRVRHGAHRLLTSCLPMVQQMEKVTLTLNILYIGATLQQCYKFVIQHQRKCLEKLWAGLETEGRRQTMENEIMDLSCFDASVTETKDTITESIMKMTFAYGTVKDRMPALIDTIIDDLDQNNLIIQNFGKMENTKMQWGKCAMCPTTNQLVPQTHGFVYIHFVLWLDRLYMAGRRDLVSAIIGLTLLKVEIVNNVAILPFISPAEDEPIWNKYLWQRYIDTAGVTEKWLTSSWLYVECYMYRRIQQIFESSYVLKFYDPFRTQKEALLEQSMCNIMILGKYVEEVREDFNIEENVEKALYFLQFLKVSLWGNHFDLSRPIENDVHDVKTPLENLDILDSHIVVNNSEEVWKMLNNVKQETTVVNEPEEGLNTGEQNIIIDFVNDNASYELFCDFCLADFLCFSGLANKINFHVKAMPWFISDATIHDCNWLLHVLSESSNVSSSLLNLSARWRNYLDSGAWQIYNEGFWTLPHTYNEMKTWDEELYNSLRNVTLIIFKGDVNYRKLLAEKNWPSTETFNIVLQGFHPTNLVSLRTVKSELICGMKPYQAENLTDEIPDWMLSGDYGVIHFDRYKNYIDT